MAMARFKGTLPPPTISRSDWTALNDLIGRAMLCDDTCSRLLRRRTRLSILKKSNLPLNLWLRLTSFEDVQDIHEFAATMIVLFGLPDAMM
jgi:hypothetical protein